MRQARSSVFVEYSLFGEDERICTCRIPQEVRLPLTADFASGAGDQPAGGKTLYRQRRPGPQRQRERQRHQQDEHPCTWL